MQSIRQYRRLRQDLAEARRGKLPSESLAKTSTSSDNEAAKDPTEKPAAIDPALVRGVTVSRPQEGDGSTVYVVGWRDNDPSNPQVWSLPRKWMAMINCCCLSIALTIPTSVEGPAQEAFQDHFGVSPMAGSMSTGIFLIGVGVGSLFSGPLSETFGRNIVYFVSMVVVMLFIMAKALAPSYGVALAFRFFGALFAATPMTGDISIWSPIIASAIFGYTLVCIFTTIYMYIIFVYLQHSASALGFMTFARYAIPGALSPASIKMYENIGAHWPLTIVGIIAMVMAPVPYVLYKYGHKVSAMSRNVQNRA
ncbi:major facilitator superfamily domain-containing protein [Aspergillus flavus]|uniref:Major facilitator superfamily domain-containing protein n=1 Tax=Aspergillus flavus TaxID=5059 RepID=A0A5N6H5Q2_ASPFL|nr:major facilitator superfamily domain-containing protein [Aspergillus flavus]